MGYKNEIRRKKPYILMPFFNRIFPVPTTPQISVRRITESPGLIVLSYWQSIGKTLPIYVNNFTNCLHSRPLLGIFFGDIYGVILMFEKNHRWLVLTLQKSIVYARAPISEFPLVSTNSNPINYYMNNRFDNNNNSCLITNNPIGGYLCPSGMDGKN